MSLLGETIDNTTTQELCPRCTSFLIVDQYKNIHCSKCNLSISSGGMVRCWSLNKEHKDWSKEEKRKAKLLKKGYGK